MAFGEVLIAVVLISPQQAGTRGNLSPLSVWMSLSLSLSPVTLNEPCAVSDGRLGLSAD